MEANKGVTRKYLDGKLRSTIGHSIFILNGYFGVDLLTVLFCTIPPPTSLQASASSKRVKLDEGKVHESESGNIDSHDMESTIHGLGAKVRANPAVRLSDEEKNEETKALEGAAAAARTALVLEDDLLLESGFSSFPAKLMSLLDGCEVQDSMWWLPDGDAFCLVPSTFDATLEKHFQGTKFESFTRKLNRW